MISNHLPDAADRTLALQKLRGLPPLSATTTRILSQTLDSDSSMADLEHIFRSDPSLTTNLLMTANSAAFSGRSRISTILHALSILGLDRVRSLAMAVTMSRYIKATIPPRTKAVEHVWTHAVATAVIAEQLGKFSNLTSSSVLYTAGLMHDMGRLGLLASIREPYQHFLGTEFLNIKESEEQEIQIFGISHTTAGEYLLHTWELPQALSDCCRHHHDDAEPDGEEVRIIRTACIIADVLGYPELVVKERVRSVSAEIWVEAHATDSLRDDVEAMIGALLV